MSEVNVHEAKTQLSQLLHRVEAGEEIIIARAGKPVARLVPVGAGTAPRPMGLDAGRVRIAPDFDAPLPEDVLGFFLATTGTRSTGSWLRSHRSRRFRS